MANKSYIFRFFSKVSNTYNNMLQHIHGGLQEGKYTQTSYEEVNFILKFLSKLHIDYKQEQSNLYLILEEMLKGGHVQLDDNGQFYDELVRSFKSSLSERISSHHSVQQQYSLSYPIVKEVLFGVTEDKDGNKRTWIQFEKHNTKTLINLIMHIVDFIRYKWTGKNIGPFGSSEHTDENPLVISPNDSNNPGI